MIKKAIYLVVIIIGAFSLYQTASAQTVYQTGAFGGVFLYDINGATIEIRNDVPRNQIHNVPLNVEFNIMRILTTGGTTPRAFLSFVKSTSTYNFLNCDTFSCFNEGTVTLSPNFNQTGFNSFSQLFENPTLSGSYIHENTFTTKIATTTGTKLRILLDTNTPRFSHNIYTTNRIGTRSYSTSNLVRNDGIYFMLCKDFCDSEFSYTLAESDLTPINTLDSLTKFTGATVQGASTTVNFDVSYFLNTPEYTANTRPDLIQVLVGRDGFGQVALAREFILPLTDGNHTKNVPVNYDLPDTKEFIDGDYYAYINFWNLTTDSLAFNKTNVVLTFTIDNGLVINQQVISLTDGTEISANIQYQDCSLSNIQGCLINAFIYVFVPAPDAFNKFLNLWQRIENKAPFGYVVGILDALNGLTDNATPAFSFGDIPFINEIFTPFRDLLIIGLWVLYALFFMGRLSKIQI